MINSIYDKSVAKLPQPIKKNWMYANSIHLIDYSNIFVEEKLYLHQKIFLVWIKGKIITFIAKYNSGDKLIYNALWNIPGPWSVIISNKKIL